MVPKDSSRKAAYLLRTRTDLFAVVPSEVPRHETRPLLSMAPAATQLSLSLCRGLRIDLLFGRGDGLEEPSWVFASRSPLRIITGKQVGLWINWLEAGTVVRLGLNLMVLQCTLKKEK
ncbi:hypothetical protein KQX54_010102 [Cotesia glomerata]|uniref:Uncharacterized protein n=1 Tax=Cotesia glomerata TaxID=32391 RepID=A0AAV7HWP6_COTGL|nr:hypothetical protein KQX54_010102 [Cotesia glomerata]